MSFKIIRPQLATLMTATGKFVEVSGTPKFEFSGYPACYIVPSENESDYETNVENTRVYAFNIVCLVETKHRGIEASIEAMEDLVDTVLDALDQEDRKTGATRTVAIGLPARYTYLNIQATPSSWGEVEEPSLLLANVTVGLISVDVS